MLFNLHCERLLAFLMDRDRIREELATLNQRAAEGVSILRAIKARLDTMENKLMATQEEVQAIKDLIAELKLGFEIHVEEVQSILGNLDSVLDAIAARIQVLIDNGTGGPDLAGILADLQSAKDAQLQKLTEVKVKAQAVLAEADSLDGQD
jgi:hypothetical protein